MSYRIPLKAVSNPKKITAALAFIYITITAFLLLGEANNTVQNKKANYLTHTPYITTPGSGAAYISSNTPYTLTNN